MRAMSIFSFVLALIVSACSDASRIDVPVFGRLSWYAFIGGEDILAGCKPGTPARYRFVYNAVLDEQVRAYDIARMPGGATFHARVPTSGIAMFEFRSDAASQLKPRRDEVVNIDEAAYLAIARQLEADGFGGQTPTGRNFPSWDFYWLVSACADGKFHINAWRHGSPEFAALRFPALLYAHDNTEIPVNPARDNAYADYRQRLGQGNPERNFDIRLAPDGLAQRLRIF